jgi:hypothetical protein
MNEKIEEILIQSGWFEDRKIDMSGILHEWIRKKYIITKENIELIESFGLMIIDVNNHRIEINPLKQYFNTETLKEYTDYFGMPLIPIGSILYENTFLLMNHQGNIYGVFDEFVCFAGNDFFEFIQNVFDNALVWDEVEELK